MKRLLMLGTAVLSAGCTAGPSYDGPPAVASDAATRGTFARAADPVLAPAPALARWWEGLNDSTLTRLVDDALAHSPSIDEAVARVRCASRRGGA